MIAKCFELRDSGTFIPVLAIKLDPQDNEGDRYLLARAGYGSSQHEQSEYIQLVRIDGGGGQSCCDPYSWNGQTRTLPLAHKYIIENFDSLNAGDVIDIEFIMGETTVKKKSERHHEYF